MWCLKDIIYVVTYHFSGGFSSHPAFHLWRCIFMQISKEALDFRSQFRNLRKTQNLCMCGLLIALYIVLSLCNIRITDTLEIRIGFLAFIAAAMTGGPVMGFAVGFLGDMLNSLVRGFAYFPGFSFSYALTGAIFGLILYRAKMSKLRAACCAFAEYLISISLTSAWLYLMYGTPLQVLLTSRLIKCTLNFFVNIIIIYVFIEAFQKILRVAFPARK